MKVRAWFQIAMVLGWLAAMVVVGSSGRHERADLLRQTLDTQRYELCHNGDKPIEWNNAPAWEDFCND